MSAELVGIIEFICRELASITNCPAEVFTASSALIGSPAVVASLEFVQLLLAIEDYTADQLGFAFDWTSDSAMSEARSHFRTVETLANYLVSLSSRA